MIGPRFYKELVAAGLGHLSLTWSAAGIMDLDRLSPSDQAAVQAVLAAHNPEAPLTDDDRASDALDGNNKMDQMIFGVLFDLTNEVRVLKGQQAISAQAFRTAMIARYKALP